VLLFAEELASVVLTPFILAFSLPNCAGERASGAALWLSPACMCLAVAASHDPPRLSITNPLNHCTPSRRHPGIRA
jgi:hypothetical protein